MAIDDESRRRRQREEQREAEREADRIAERARELKRGPGAASKSGEGSSDGAQSLEELLAQIEPLLDQVDHLHQHYVLGLEAKPPLERRGLLESLLKRLDGMQSGGAALAFRASGIRQRYATLSERWGRLLKDVESGKITRVKRGGPKG